MNVTKIIFNKFNAETRRYDKVSVDPANVVAFHNANRTASVIECFWDDGLKSWAKAWYFGDDTGDIARIGAGAYGDKVIWCASDYDTRMAALYRRGYA